VESVAHLVWEWKRAPHKTLVVLALQIAVLQILRPWRPANPRHRVQNTRLFREARALEVAVVGLVVVAHTEPAVAVDTLEMLPLLEVVLFEIEA